MYTGKNEHGFWAMVSKGTYTQLYLYANNTLHDQCDPSTGGGYWKTEADRDLAIKKYLESVKVSTPNKEKVMPTTCKRKMDYLALTSGLYVTSRQEKGQEVYDFYTDSSRSMALKTTFCYKKAKMFAEGVAMGRKLENMS